MNSSIFLHQERTFPLNYLLSDGVAAVNKIDSIMDFNADEILCNVVMAVRYEPRQEIDDSLFVGMRYFLLFRSPSNPFGLPEEKEDLEIRAW